jgi:hypothetical protein
MRLKIGIIASSAASGFKTLFSIATNFLFSTNTDKLYAYDGENVEGQDFIAINDLEYDADNNITLAAGNQGLLLKSADNINWNAISAPTNKDINVIKYANGLYFLGVDND